MKFFESLSQVDKSAFNKSGLSRLAAKLPASFSALRTAEGRHGTLLIISIAVAVIAAFVLGPDTTGVATTGEAAGEALSPGEAGTEIPGGTVDTATPGGDPGSGGGTTSTRPLNPLAELDYIKKIGALIRPVSTSIPGGNRNTWVGVSDKEIKTAFSLDVDGCGVDALVALQKAAGQLPSSNRFYRAYPDNQENLMKDRKEAIDILFRYYNDNALDGAEYLPHIRPLMGNDRNRPFYGRRLTYQIINGGNGQAQCTAVTTAGAVDAISKGAFTVYTDNLDGSAYNMAAALNAKAPPDKRPMHFGTLQLSDKFYTQWAPYAWTQFATGTTATRQFASYVCSKLVGKQVSRQVSTTVGQPTRKFGMIHPNLQEYQILADEFRGYVKQYCGEDIIGNREATYDTDISRAVDQAHTLITRMHSDGVTSLLMLTDLLFPLFQIQAASEERYLPEWVWAGFNYTDAAAVQRLYDDFYKDEVNKASFGISNFGVPGGFGYGAGDVFYVYHRYHKVAPDGKPCDPSSDAGMNHGEDPNTGPNARYCKAPATIVTLYYTSLASVSCMVFAGPNLNPANCSQGLQDIPNIRYGGSGPTEDPRPAAIGPGRGKFGFINDSVEWKWRADFKSPYPEHKDGWVEYPDCQRHYLLWPNQYSAGWEVGGPHHNSWCGNAKYAPDDSPEKDNYPRITDGRTAAEAKY